MINIISERSSLIGHVSDQLCSDWLRDTVECK